jgi:PKD repeat protein
MKAILKVLVAAALTTAATGCSDFLDINENPNSPITSTPDAILAQALTATAANYSIGYNHYSSFATGYWGKSGTVNGYTEERTYNYTSSFQQNLFNSTYDNLLDYNIIQEQGAQSYPNHAAIARIMKVYNFQLLVDQYGDVPYTDALKGLGTISPKYDKAENIYKDFIIQLDGAIADIKTAAANPNVLAVGAEDIVFRGNMTNWIQFANSLKLRVLLRQSQVPSLDAYVKTEMTKLQASTDGFITDDVMAQPGYLQSEGKQNPFYNRYGRTSANLNATERRYQVGTKYVMSQYVNNKDPRAFRLYATVGGAFKGVELGEPDPIQGNAASLFRLNGGLLKGPDAPTPLMLLAEHLFSKAEAETRGLFTGGDAAASASYRAGVTASFVYFYRPAPSQRGTAIDSSAFVTTGLYTPTATDLANLTPEQITTKVRLNSGKVARYFAANVGNPKVDYDAAAVGTNGKQEVIIYQKYLAENSVASTEAWADYRRTGLPKFPASLESLSPRADKLPVRLLYPLSEVTTNASNVPQGINQFTSKIFWDVVD